MTAAQPDAVESRAPPLPTPPRRPLPAGSCDTHTHVFGPYDRYPLVLQAKYEPPYAPAPAHLAMRSRVGLDRAILVQTAPYAGDCTIILDAVSQAPETLRGVATATRQTSAETLARWAAGGIVGLRFMEVLQPDGSGRFAGAASFDDLAFLAPVMRDLGLHAQVWADCWRIARDRAFLAGLGVPVVIEHMGRFETAKGAEDAAFQTLIRMLREGQTWIKLSVCRASAAPPDYQDARVFHDALVAAAPDRLLWASDWPHVGMGAKAPDVGRLIDLFDAWTDDDETLRKRVFVKNPEMLYGFPAQHLSSANRVLQENS